MANILGMVFSDRYPTKQRLEQDAINEQKQEAGRNAIERLSILSRTDEVEHVLELTGDQLRKIGL
jgi:hypothetical protein